MTYAGPGIVTQGGMGDGIATVSGSGSIGVDSSGPITTSGPGALGILADSGTIVNQTPGLGGPITVDASGKIATSGEESHGIWAASTTGSVQVNATNVSTTGEFSTAITRPAAVT